LFEIVVPVAFSVVGVFGVVADQRIGVIGFDHLGIGPFLHIAADASVGGLEFAEIVDVADILPAAGALSGVFPGVVPFDRSVDFPVCDDDIEGQVFVLVCFDKRFDLGADGVVAGLHRKRAADLDTLGVREVEEGVAVRVDVGGGGVAIEETVHDPGGIDHDGHAEPLLDSREGQRVREHGIATPVVPVGHRGP
jgi:hypothetical protein